MHLLPTSQPVPFHPRPSSKMPMAPDDLASIAIDGRLDLFRMEAGKPGRLTEVRVLTYGEVNLDPRTKHVNMSDLYQISGMPATAGSGTFQAHHGKRACPLCHIGR